MGKFRTIKNSFLGGQISRTAVGRTDLPQYGHACELLQNMIPMLGGGAYRRPGTYYIDALQESTGTCDRPPRLIPFVVSQSEAYAVLLSVASAVGGGSTTGCYAKTYRLGLNTGSLLAGNVYNLPNIRTGTPGELPYRATVPGFNYNWATSYQQGPSGGNYNAIGGIDDEIWQIQTAQANDIMWLVHPAYKPQTIRRTALDTFTVEAFDAGLSGLALAQAYPYLNQNATSSTMALSAASGSGVTLTCSKAYFNALQVGAIFAIQSGTLSGSGGGVLFAQVTACGGTPSSPSTTCTVTILYNSASGYSPNTALTEWWESAWSNYRGWPSTICVFQQRLCMGGTVPVPSLYSSGVVLDPLGIPAGQPDSTWCSETGDYFKFTALGDTAVAGITGTLANGQNYTTPGDFVYYPVDDAQGDGQSRGPVGIQPFRITLADSQLDTIQWLSPDQEILVGTLDQEWVIAPQNGSFDVANSSATIQSHYGSSKLSAVRIGYELMFLLAGGDEVRAYQYNYIDASFFGEPVQMFFDEYPIATSRTAFYGNQRKIRQMSWDRSRNTLWCVDSAGSLFGMTRDRKLQVTMWHTHQLGGYNTAQPTGAEIAASMIRNLGSGGSYTDPAYQMCDGSVVSAVNVPNAVTGLQDIWMVAKRSQGGSIQWFVEVMCGKNTVRQSAYESVDLNAFLEPVYVDCAQLLDDLANGSSNYTYTGATALNGYALNGTYYSATYGLFAISTNTVSAGALTLNQPLPPDYGSSSGIAVGLPYVSAIQPVRIDIQSQSGTSQGAIKRIAKAYLRLYKTLLCKAGSPPGMSSSGPEVVLWPRGQNQELAQSPEIFTGDKEVFVTSQYGRAAYFYVMQDQPLPFTLISITFEGEEYEQ